MASDTAMYTCIYGTLILLTPFLKNNVSMVAGYNTNKKVVARHAVSVYTYDTYYDIFE